VRLGGGGGGGGLNFLPEACSGGGISSLSSRSKRIALGPKKEIKTKEIGEELICSHEDEQLLHSYGKNGDCRPSSAYRTKGKTKMKNPGRGSLVDKRGFEKIRTVIE